MFSYDRIRDPDDPKSGAASINHIDYMEATGPRELRIVLSEADATLVDSLAEYQMGIVPEGYDPKNPVGSGPFKLEYFSPASRPR
ncbi:hypothetical protein IA203_06030 [Corynebacterium wankanglinii]|nr:hypothetical protein IA203_06030 [Corynebacterium wankanglinii]